MCAQLYLKALLLITGCTCNGFVIPSQSFILSTREVRQVNKLTVKVVPETTSLISELSTSLIAYSDDPLGDQLKGLNGVITALILGTIAVIGFAFKALIPSVGKTSFTLTPEEEDAISRTKIGFDSKAWEQELTEEGSKGFVNRRRQAQEARDSYQEGKSSIGLKDRSLRYTETDLGFVACLIRAANPNAGESLVVLGSGAGRSTLGAAAIFPKFKKCIGVEFLQPLVQLSNSYRGKVKGKKAQVEFVEADFAEYDLSETDLVFAAATYFNNGDFETSLESLRSGCKVMTIDKRLGKGFTLLSEIDDPSGDLVLNTGFLYEKS